MFTYSWNRFPQQSSNSYKSLKVSYLNKPFLLNTKSSRKLSDIQTPAQAFTTSKSINLILYCLHNRKASQLNYWTFLRFYKYDHKGLKMIFRFILFDFIHSQ